MQIEFTIRGEIDDEEAGQRLNGQTITTRHQGAMEMVLIGLELEQCSDARDLLQGTIRMARRQELVARLRREDAMAARLRREREGSTA